MKNLFRTPSAWFSWRSKPDFRSCQITISYLSEIFFSIWNISFLHVVIVSSKWKFFRGIVITFPAVFYIFLGIFSARMHKISHEAKPSEKFYAWRLRKCQEKCRKQLEKCWQFQGKIGTCETALPHVRILFSVIHASIPKKKFWIFKRIS